MLGTVDNVEDIYELSPMQEGMLYDTLHAADTGLYVEQLLCTVRGRIDSDLFARAWQTTLERHPVLRTAFVWEGLDRPMQAVRLHATVPIEERDLRSLAPAQQSVAVEELLRADRAQGFALDRAPLMRVTLVRMEEERAQFLWTHHHLLLDGWSVPIVLQETAAAYDALARGLQPTFASRRPYRDYIVWLRSRDANGAEAAWRADLAGASSSTPLPLARAGADTPADTITTELRLSATDTRAVETFAREHGLTLHTVMLGAWAMLLSGFSGTDSILCGSSVSGRPGELEGSDRMVGLFINSLPVHVRVDAATRVGDWLRALQARQAVLRAHESTPLVAIQRWLGLTGTTPFESLLVFVNYPVDAAMASQGSALSLESVRGFERTSVPLTVFAVPGRELGLKLMSDTGRYSPATLASLASRLRTVVVNLATDGDRPVGAVPLVDAGEQHQLLNEWDAPVEPVPAVAAHQLFEAQAAATPAALALMQGAHSLTYAELERRANQLARFLSRGGLHAGDAVALSVDRTCDMIVAALAIMKAGASYVPIDPEFPPERIALMLQGAGASVLITESHHLDALPPFSGRVVTLDGDRQAIIEQAAEPLHTHVDPAADAYLIFTSGSTGVPKGAAIPHSALVNLLLFMRRTPGLAAGDRMLAIATMSFDLAVLECFLPLSSGAAIVLADRAAATDARRLHSVLLSGGVTVMQGTPSTWRLLLASGWDGTPRLKMLTGGEPLTVGLARELLARGTSVWNLYGPTETTIYSTWREVREPDTEGHGIEPIGRPMPNQPHYILDRSMRLVPVGAVGEIYIGGMCVARGYAHRPDLTAERFVPDPFGGEAGARLYRSGDLARYRADGVIEFVGRADFQVKIRGYRVELGEIESAIEKLPGVRECLVLARADAQDEPGERRLVAYVRPVGGAELDVAGARGLLRQQLPEYMVPTAFVVLEDFPRLPNGKPDRKRLPAPGAARPPLAVAFESPAGADEQTVARLWQDTLKVDRIGANDNFFDVGGHSLLAVGLLGKLREAFGRDLSLVDLFTYPTVRSMAAHLAGTAAGGATDTEADTGAAQARVAARRSRRQE